MKNQLLRFALILFLIFTVSFAYAGPCDQNKCPEAQTICCQETISILWGAFEYTITHYAKAVPTIAEVDGITYG